ncbi:type III pantothenate kinase [Porticoccaceae bacterium]|nr:type III pantothenate kinase [Porticoccaceae bacterium]MDA9014135.1 type III pantothenate kinase [Porticoccaceae bacterium]MDA9569612.1 type III pantothenate kinase [Porticoccaceae bacterium]
MILVIDAGNSRIKWRLTDRHQIVAEGGQLTPRALEDEIFSLSDMQPPSEIRIASVAGDKVVDWLYQQLRKQFDGPIRLAQVASTLGELSCAYEDPKSLGIDRWLAIAAAYNQYNEPLLVIDAGSAITMDIIGPGGQHVGGYIAPGLTLMHDALWKNTSDVRVVGSGSEELWLPGKNTQQAVNRGCLLAAVSTIESLAAQFPVRIVITGGDAKILIQAMSLSANNHANLVLDGLILDGVELIDL